MPPAVFFLLRIDLAMRALFWFYMKFMVVFSRSLKKVNGSLIVRINKLEIKEKILRAAREKGQVTHKGKPIRLTAHLLAETL